MAFVMLLIAGVWGFSLTVDYPAAPIITLDDQVSIDTVKRGSMLVEINAPGMLMRDLTSRRATAQIDVGLPWFSYVKTGQEWEIGSGDGRLNAPGRVARVGAWLPEGSRRVNLDLRRMRFNNASGIVSIVATLHADTLENVLWVGRPVHAAPMTCSAVFKLNKQGTEMAPVAVAFGRPGTNSIEILSGLNEGDRIVLSDMSQWDAAERVIIRAR